MIGKPCTQPYVGLSFCSQVGLNPIPFPCDLWSLTAELWTREAPGHGAAQYIKGFARHPAGRRGRRLARRMILRRDAPAATRALHHFRLGLS